MSFLCILSTSFLKAEAKEFWKCLQGRDSLESTHETINIFKGIKCTREEENNNTPRYPEWINRGSNDKLVTQVYHKTTHTNQILHQQSNNPTSHNTSCVGTLFRLAQTYCSNTEHQKNNPDHLYIFQQNGYSHNTTSTSCEKENIVIQQKMSQKPHGITQPHGSTQPTMHSKIFQVNSKTHQPQKKKTGVIYNILCCQHSIRTVIATMQGKYTEEQQDASLNPISSQKT